jgi:hypothetical protein
MTSRDDAITAIDTYAAAESAAAVTAAVAPLNASLAAAADQLAADAQRIADDEAKIAQLTAELGQYALWQPTDLARLPWTRPSGAGYVTWESIVGSTAAAAQAAAPNTLTTLTLSVLNSLAAAGKIVTLPRGRFAMPNGYTNNGASASLWFGTGTVSNTCRGLAGSGAGGIFADAEETSLERNATTGGGNLIYVNHITGFYLGGLSLINHQVLGDGVYNTGIFLATSPGAVFEHLYTRGLNPGYANSPPGEGFGINVWHSADAVVRDCEFDGRDLRGGRTCASPMGWNSVTNTAGRSNVARVYSHHGRCSMLTFWQVTNLQTEDYYCYSWSSGTGNQSGAGINHEQSGGVIRHYRPRLFINGAKAAGPVVGAYGHPPGDTVPHTASNGPTFNLQSGLSDAGANFEMWYPQFDNTLGSSGLICMGAYDGYTLGQAIVTPPKIYLEDAASNPYLLLKTDHPTSGWSSKDPKAYFAWIH